MDHILSGISQANTDELKVIIDATISRYTKLYPQWDLTVLALPRNDPQACVEKLKMMITFIEKHVPSK